MPTIDPVASSGSHPRVLVSDFDGTLAHPDFYQLVKNQLVPAEAANFWEEYRSGQITHFDALRKYFLAAAGGEAALLAIVNSISMPADLAGLLTQLSDHGWCVIIASAGCQWYIDRLLERSQVSLPVFANPGRIENDRLHMSRPVPSPYTSHENGTDKSAVVRALLDAGKTVAYCGDGFTDFSAAVLVADELRFARADLAAQCQDNNVNYHPFEAWHEVVEGLIAWTASHNRLP